MIPAVSSPSAAGGLRGAEFDRAVAELISGTLKKTKCKPQ